LADATLLVFVLLMITGEQSLSATYFVVLLAGWFGASVAQYQIAAAAASRSDRSAFHWILLGPLAVGWVVWWLSAGAGAVGWSLLFAITVSALPVITGWIRGAQRRSASDIEPAKPGVPNC